MDTDVLLKLLEQQHTAAAEEADRLRAQINTLTGQLAAAENTAAGLATTADTVRATVTDHDPDDETDTGHRVRLDPGTAVETVPAYRRILAVFDNTRTALHPIDLCRLLETGEEPKHREAMRSKLKRLVDRGILHETEPGLFIHAEHDPAGPAPADTESDEN